LLEDADLAKVDFVEHDFVGVADAPESCEESGSCDEEADDLVIAFRRLGGGLRGGVFRNQLGSRGFLHNDFLDLNI